MYHLNPSFIKAIYLMPFDKKKAVTFKEPLSIDVII